MVAEHQSLLVELAKCAKQASLIYSKIYTKALKDTENRFLGAKMLTYFIMDEIKASNTLRGNITNSQGDGASYDYLLTDPTRNHRISFKGIISVPVFQRPNDKSKNKSNTTAGSIMLSNTMNQSELQDYAFIAHEFDYLMVLQHQNIDKKMKLGVGIISSSSMIDKHNNANGVVFKQTKDQILVKIDNSAYEILDLDTEYHKFSSANDTYVSGLAEGVRGEDEGVAHMECQANAEGAW